MFKKLQFLYGAMLVMAMILSACGGQTATPAAEEPAVEEPTEAPATEAPAAVEPTEPPAAEVPAQSDIVINVTPAGSSTTTFTYNFNPFSTTFLFPTHNLF